MRIPRSLPAALFLHCVASIVLGVAAGRAQVASVPPINTRSRAQVVESYRNYYLSSDHILPVWTGNVAAGMPGAVNPEYLRATLRRINYFRAMSGLPGNVVFDPVNNARCQQAALMMAAARTVSHEPPHSWKFYTREAALAAAHGDLNLDWRGDQGPGAINRYMDDPGDHNACVGHRRWLLAPSVTTMGAGVVPANGGNHPGVNVTWVTDGAPRLIEVADNAPLNPVPAAPAVSWPPVGFVPANLVYSRWSFAVPCADFRRAVVEVSKEGRVIPVAQERPLFQSAADGSGPCLGANTLVWTLPGNVVSRAEDETYRVRLTNVIVGGQAREFTYTVTSIDPARRGRLDPAAGENGERLASNVSGVR